VKRRYETTFLRCAKSQMSASHIHCGGSLKSRKGVFYYLEAHIVG